MEGLTPIAGKKYYQKCVSDIVHENCDGGGTQIVIVVEIKMSFLNK